MSSVTRICAATLAQVVNLEPIQLRDEEAESLKFRIEVFRWASDRFTCQLWRRETYRLEPSFQLEDGRETWDAETYVLETGLAWENIEGPSIEHVVEATLREIEERFLVVIERPDSLRPENSSP